MKRLFLIDAYALIYRAYYALIKTPRYNSKGLNTSVMLGFVNVLEDVLRREQPTHVAVAFDPPGPTFRHQADAQYKAQREATPEDIRKSVPYIKQLLEAYRIPVLQVEGFEADDVIGTLSGMAEKAGFEVYMLTPDKDYGQLVSAQVKMYRPRHTGGYDILGPREVCEKYGLQSKEQVIDLLGLMGDSSDNIPGCPGVGEKTAVKLLNEFGSIENLLEHTADIKGALRQKVEEAVEQIRFSKFLATIRTDVPIAFNEEQLAHQAPDVPRLLQCFDELEFRKLAEQYRTQLSNHQNQAPAQAAAFGKLQDTPHSYHTLTNPAAWQELTARLVQAEAFSFAVLGTVPEPMQAQWMGVAFCLKAGEAYWLRPDDTNRNQLFDLLKPVFAQANSLKIAYHCKNALWLLESYGIEVKGPLCDPMLAHYVLQPELRHQLDYLAEVYLHYQALRYEAVAGQGAHAIDLRFADPVLLANYACESVDVAWQLAPLLLSELDKGGVRKLYQDIEMPLVRTLCRMERAGVRIDTAALRQSSALLGAQLLQIEQQARQLTGVDFNLSSAKQVGELLFDRLQIAEKPKKTKTGQYQTSEEVLEALRGKHPVVPLILEHRSLKKLLGTYIDALPLLVDSRTGKIHTTFNQAVTATGRLSSSNPNLQNIPVRDELGKEIRRCFVPDEGHLFFSADYSQIELRIMAHLSGDEAMIDAFKQGQDVHQATAAKIFKVPIDQVSKEMRRQAKTANFGIIYGISVFGLGERLGIARNEAKNLIDGYFETYPQLKNYMEQCIAQARERGYVETMFGRKRYLPDINSHNSVVRGFAERNAINAPIQGTAADIIKVAMIRIDQRFESSGLRSRMILQVHDELNFDVYPNELQQVHDIVCEEMARAVALRVPLLADCGTGNNWLEAH